MSRQVSDARKRDAEAQSVTGPGLRLSRLAPECHESVTRNGSYDPEPCEKVAVAARIFEGEPYPVCAKHTRAPMVSLSELLTAAHPTRPEPVAAAPDEEHDDKCEANRYGGFCNCGEMSLAKAICEQQGGVWDFIRDQAKEKHLRSARAVLNSDWLAAHTARVAAQAKADADGWRELAPSQQVELVDTVADLDNIGREALLLFEDSLPSWRQSVKRAVREFADMHFPHSNKPTAASDATEAEDE